MAASKRTKTKPTMSATDRRDLRRVIDERFKILQKELDQRRELVDREIRKRLIEESQARVEQARARMEPLIAKVEAIQREAEAEVEKISQDLDVVPGTLRERTIWDPTGRSIAGRRFEVEPISGPVRLAVSNDWAPARLEDDIAAELEKLGDERIHGGQSLDLMRLDLQEKLLTTVMNGTASDFLSRIPELDELLPPPKQLPSAT